MKNKFNLKNKKRFCGNKYVKSIPILQYYLLPSGNKAWVICFINGGKK